MKENKLIFFPFITNCFFLFILLNTSLLRSNDFILIQSTTSTRDSGFYEYLIPKFKDKFKIEVRVVAVGTGQAIKNAMNCDADLLLVHHQPSEQNFINNGFGLFREVIMQNNYVLVGPKQNFSLLKNNISLINFLKKIHKEELNFISRGDNSGTHKKELELWKLSNLLPNPKIDKWYFDVGQGMGSALNIAVNKNAFTISDRATWINFKNKQNHVILSENITELRNDYSVIPINPNQCPNTKLRESMIFINWIISKEGKRFINEFKVDGKQVFISN